MPNAQIEFNQNADNLARLCLFRPIDDAFMRVMFRDNLPLAEYVLRVIIQRSDLRLVREETQKDLTRLAGARGLCLDVHGVDSEDNQYDIEIQRADTGARPERARYHASAMDVENLSAGQEFEELPESYVIFITEGDVFHQGKPIYHIERHIVETDAMFSDRQHILYVTASHEADDELGRLMHDFMCADPDSMYNSMMAERARYLKTDPKGVEMMCKIMEDVMNEGKQRARLEDIKNIMEALNFTSQQAMDVMKIPQADREKYTQLLAQ